MNYYLHMTTIVLMVIAGITIGVVIDEPVLMYALTFLSTVLFQLKMEPQE